MAGVIGGLIGLIIICLLVVIAIILTIAQKRSDINISVLFFGKSKLCTALIVILISC